MPGLSATMRRGGAAAPAPGTVPQDAVRGVDVSAMNGRVRQAVIAAAAFFALSSLAVVAAPVVSRDAARLRPAPATRAPAAGAPSWGAEERIERLHAVLDQAPASRLLQWEPIAEVLRDNAQRQDEALGRREAARLTMSAIDDLQAEAELAAVKARALDRLLAAFQPLYGAMSDDDRRMADLMLRGPARPPLPAKSRYRAPTAEPGR